MQNKTHVVSRDKSVGAARFIFRPVIKLIDRWPHNDETKRACNIVILEQRVHKRSELMNLLDSALEWNSMAASRWAFIRRRN